MDEGEIRLQEYARCIEIYGHVVNFSVANECQGKAHFEATPTLLVTNIQAENRTCPLSLLLSSAVHLNAIESILLHPVSSKDSTRIETSCRRQSRIHALARHQARTASPINH